jgi:hypothetical protein
MHAALLCVVSTVNNVRKEKNCVQGKENLSLAHLPRYNPTAGFVICRIVIVKQSML